MEFRLLNVNSAEEVVVFVYLLKDTNLVTFELAHDGKRYSSVFDDILYWFGKKVRTLTTQNIQSVRDNTNLYYKGGIFLKVKAIISAVHHGDDDPNWKVYDQLGSLFEFHGIWIRQPEKLIK